MPRRILRIVPIVALLANGLAALSWGDGYETCASGSWKVARASYAETRVPYFSVQCERGFFTFHDETFAAALFWLLVAATALAVAFRFRRSSTARAAGAAVLVLPILAFE